MSFARQRFLGLTVIDFTSSIGWNDEGSKLEIKIAPEDNENISAFTIGNPYNFTFGTFQFNGILERVLVSKSSSGTTYSVTLSDGKEILRNVEVVTNNFYGWKEVQYDCLVPNFLNVYRYYEAQSFGGSLADGSGILIDKFCQGVNITSANCGIIHKGIKYTIDLSNLIGIVPQFYRVAGPTINLLDAISQICDDAGYNYHIDREGYQFKVRLASLNSNGANQGVNTYIASKGKERDTISYSAGVENANGVISNVVLYGGNVEESVVTTKGFDPKYPDFDLIASFWGYNPITNQPIKGRGDQFNVLTGIGGSALIPVEWLELPTLGVEDIIGDVKYITNTFELQLVVGGKETWELWLEMYKGGTYTRIFGRPPRPLSYLAVLCTGGAAEGNITREFIAGENDIGIIRAGRIYSWLKGMADGFFGKQFLVRMAGPAGVRDKIEGYVDQYDPNKKIYNYNPTESGFLDPTDPFVQTFANFNDIGKAQSQNEEGKTLNWVIYNPPYPSYSFIGNSDEVITSDSGNQIAVKATLADKWVWWNGDPHFHLTISQPAFEIQDRNLTPRCAPVAGLTEEVGYPLLVKILFGVSYNTNAGSSNKFKIGPFPLYPSTTITNVRGEFHFYGPWISKFGNGGKTKFEQDNTVTPWNYGSRQKMGEINSLRVVDNLAFMENVETGEFTKLGLPQYSLGQELISNGPRVTGISISYNASGINTTYTARTFTPRFGILPRQTIDNIKRLAQKTYAGRRWLLKATFDLQRSLGSLIRTFMGAGIYRYSITVDLPKRHDRSTPHAVLLLQSYNPKELYGGDKPDKTKTIGGFTTVGEAGKDISIVEEDTERYYRSSAVSIDHLFRPFVNATENDFIPKIVLPDSLLQQQGGNNNPNPYIPTSISYNPLKIGSDLDLVMNETDVGSWDHHNNPSFYTINNTILAAKGVAFKGPIMVSGWGTAITGDNAHDLVPNVQNGFPWQDGKDFKVGPVDLMWDEARGVWTSHDIVLCESAQDIAGTDSIPIDSEQLFAYGDAYIYLGKNKDVSSQKITVVNIGSEDIPAYTRLLAKYDVYNNQWVVDYKGNPYRFWEECATDDLVRVEDGVDIYYWDFDIEKNVFDPGSGPLDEGYCTEQLKKVTVVKTNGYTGSYEVTKGLIECPDGSTQPILDELWFHHGLFKEAIQLETDPCENNQTTTTLPPATTTISPAICLYYDSTADCYLCRRCDTPPDGENWQPANGGAQYANADACAAANPAPDKVCVTTTIAPGCYLTPVTGSDANSCYQCIPASSYDPDNPTYDEPGQFMDCDDCAAQLEELNTSPECVTQTCLYQRLDNPFCYYCGDCSGSNSLGGFSGIDRNEACAQEANRLSASACNVTTTTLGPDICLYVNEDTGCYVCQDCRYGPDNSTNLGSYTNADLCNASIPEDGTYCTTTTVAPGCRRITDSETQCEICVPEEDSGGVGTFFNTCAACQESADAINSDVGSPCTTETYCLYEDTSTNGICYYCSTCNPDYSSQGSYTSLEACEAEASSREPASCNTTPLPTTTQNPNCVQVVSSVSCGPSGLSVSYVDVAACGVSQVYQSDFRTTILRAEVKSLKRQLSNIYNALEKYGIKIEDA